eukprot:TRINITY_DN10862_c0_g1_i2.p2 TRINITY_DN10862_c0_g1~~TRINITY_DN10862_c0_g1_i2.p2  ORF type:complete len:103 (+),score=47.73 TRINITY_DN10862_c0_g1_i2:64-372(+)
MQSAAAGTAEPPVPAAASPPTAVAAAEEEEHDIYEDVKLEEMEWLEDEGVYPANRYSYDCPCGDVFTITLEELAEGVDVLQCPTCSLQIRVLYDRAQFAKAA